MLRSTSCTPMCPSKGVHGLEFDAPGGQKKMHAVQSPHLQARVHRCKRDMKLNDATPDITVDPETYVVTADGQHLTCDPAERLPLAQRYSLF